MSLKMDKSILSEFLSDEKFVSELVEYLNSAIDKELEKSDEDMDTSLIDDCVRILSAIDEGDFAAITDDESSSEKVINFAKAKEQTEQKNTTHKVIRFRKVLVIAAVVAVISTVSLQVFPGVANSVKSFLNQAVDSLWHTSDESASAPTSQGEAEIFGIEVIFPDDEDENVKDLAEAKDLMSRCTYYAYDESDVKTEIAFKDMTVKYTQTTDDNGKQCILVAVGYRGAAETVPLYIAQ
ncbi:MAG: hypothetical protein IJ077_00225 [Eubacterium sp.]|nr:hypothetical protein [Eubacterium sp.]MBR1531735.1 hypothetical protein [Eubacterium sp.]